MIDVLEEAARAGGKVLLKHFQQELQVTQKTSQHNIVTQADTEAQKVIHQKLLTGMIAAGYKEEEIGFIGEEEGMNKPAKYTFVIDPLDGTSNFAAGLDMFTTSIGLFEDDKLIAGALYNSVQDELIIGSRGKGATIKTKSGTTPLVITAEELSSKLYTMNFSSGSADERDVLTQINKKLFHVFSQVRITGSVVFDMSQFLKGKFGTILRTGTYIWDIAASVLLIEEAGGIVVDWKGKPMEFDFSDVNKRYKFIACHPDNLRKILEAINS